MSLYSELALVADDLLAEFGQPLIVRRVTTGGYDPETGGASTTNIDQPGVGCVFDYGGRRYPGESFADGSLIISGDKHLILSPVGIASIIPGDLAIIGTETWNIFNVTTTAPAGVVVVYECQLRK